MNIKDAVQWGGLAVTLFLGLWNLFEGRAAAKRSRFINTVTNQRVLWIEQLRQDLASFIGLAGPRAYDSGEERGTEWAERIELGRLKRVIEMRLNPGDDQDIKDLLGLIFKSAFARDRNLKTADHLDQLTVASQRLIKAEWEKVKDEAERGRLAVRWKRIGPT